MNSFPFWAFAFPVVGLINWLLRTKVKPKTRKKITIAGCILATVICVITISSTTYFSIFDGGYYAGDHNWCEKRMMYDDLFELSSGESQKIALIDSGISQFQQGADIQVETLVDNRYDENGHGTKMFSLIKGYEPDSEEQADLRILGIAPNAQILSIKITNDFEGIQAEKIAEAIQLAIDNNATIINLSMGSSQNNEAVSDKIREAVQKGIIVVAAAGDYGNPDLIFPANLDNVISVGALDENNKAWVESNAPEDCDILAPGVNVYALDQNKELVDGNGTSQATALISGYVALIKDYAKKNNMVIDTHDIIQVLHSVQNGSLNYAEGLKSIL